LEGQALTHLLGNGADVIGETAKGLIEVGLPELRLLLSTTSGQGKQQSQYQHNARYCQSFHF